MPTLSTTAADTIDLDYFYQKCPKSFSIGIYEDAPLTSCPIPANKQPNNCITTELRGSVKSSHYFKAPESSSVIACFCEKYHTHFISTTNQTYKQPEMTTIVRKPKDKKSLTNSIANSTEFVPPSPTKSPSPAIHNHICPKCNLPIVCKEMNNQHYLATDSVLHNDKPYHKICAEAQQPTQQSSSSPTFIQKLQQSIRSYNSLSSELTFTTSPSNNTDNSNAQSESNTQPTTNPEQGPSRVLSLQEIEQFLKTHHKNNPLISELSPLTLTIEKTANNTITNTTDMDMITLSYPILTNNINNNISNN